MNNYQTQKARAIDKAIEYQQILMEEDLSYNEIAILSDKFYKLAKRYGLIKEFRENGIL